MWVWRRLITCFFFFSLFIVAKVWRRWKEKGWPEAQRKRPEQQHQLNSSSLLIWNWKLLNCPLVPLSTSLSAITPPSVFIPQPMKDTDVWSRTLLTLITLAFFFSFTPGPIVGVFFKGTWRVCPKSKGIHLECILSAAFTIEWFWWLKPVRLLRLASLRMIILLYSYFVCLWNLQFSPLALLQGGRLNPKQGSSTNMSSYKLNSLMHSLCICKEKHLMYYLYSICKSVVSCALIEKMPLYKLYANQMNVAEGTLISESRYMENIICYIL